MKQSLNHIKNRAESNKLYNQLVQVQKKVDEEELRKIQIQNQVKTLINNKELTQEQRDVLQEYFRHTVQRIKPITLLNVFSSLRDFGCFVKKPFNKVKKQDVENYLLYLIEKGRKKSTITIRTILLKSFFRWLYGIKEPDVIKGIVPKKYKTTVNESALFTKEEVKAMIQQADSTRDKAIVSTLYDSACRIEELLTIKIKNILVDQYGIKIEVNGKTGKRSIRLVDSVPYLQQWLNCHKFNQDSEAPLFYSFARGYKGRRLKYSGVYSMLKRLAEGCCISKPIRPHLMRHSRLDYLAKVEDFNERDLRIFAGWSSTSDMPNVYLHYGEKELDNKILSKQGIIKDTEKEKALQRKVLEPKQCVRCKQFNPADALYCNCGMALDLKNVVKDLERREQADREMNELFADPEFRELLKGYLKKKQYQT